MSTAHRIKFVCDSAIDLPAAWRARWNISLIPVFVNFGDESFPDDGVSLTHDEFYRRLAESKVPPTTSAPSAGVAADVLSQALSEANHVIAFTISSAVSSTYNAVRLAARQVSAERITVYDTGTLSMAAGWQIVAACEARERGANLNGILDAVAAARARAEVWAVPGSLDYLRRGGRVNWIVSSVGTLLQIKPIITVKDGVVDSKQRARTVKKAMESIAEVIRRRAPLEGLAILHTNAPDLAEQMRALLADIAPSDAERTLILNVAAAIGVHFGPGSVGAAILSAPRE
ncbi:MAG: DegV family protein [Chloroflexi bacterium]|nr:DegV family protein [Chloroflexota bacterium]